MTGGLRRRAGCTQHGRGKLIPAGAGWRCATKRKETAMQWTTPTATDFRFGFEITLYVAAR
jgi:coenzyme PQQ precursor peptide PqqA